MEPPSAAISSSRIYCGSAQRMGRMIHGQGLTVCTSPGPALAGQPSFRHLVQHDGLRLVDLEEHSGMDVDADEHEARVVGGAVAWIASSGNQNFQSGAYSSRIFCRSRESVARPDTEIHSRVRSL